MKIAMVGLGAIAQKAYLPLMAQMGGVELVLCSRDADRLQSLCERYRVVEICRDYRELLSHRVDGVMIHAATEVHAEMAGFFLRNGIPTFVDKPLADSAEACERLYELSYSHRQPLYVGFNRRHIPMFNAQLPGVQQGTRMDLRALRWEKHRYDMAGDMRTFIFDDFIHPLDSVNIFGRAHLDNTYVTFQRDGAQLARVDVQWQHGATMLHASMNRQFGITMEHVSAQLANEAYEFDSFVEGRRWKDGQESRLALKDWTPMLASKGFAGMLDEWLAVVESGTLDPRIVERNLASHQLAESLCQFICRPMKKAAESAAFV
ncbi:Gfo/Idh/MocA family protein [Microbulbifer hainanensis]|uniref:Gfo/Idh/MocA family protein n=1 Tax=Microbulbifer hainanensis TaxID=2735675 RepID=UPI0018694B46|nr:Gfo/Idh/MocA family oxidoreductase [Microbulbifer hainanensis]